MRGVGLKVVGTDMSRRILFTSAMRIGRDHIVGVTRPQSSAYRQDPSTRGVR